MLQADDLWILSEKTGLDLGTDPNGHNPIGCALHANTVLTSDTGVSRKPRRTRFNSISRLPVAWTGRCLPSDSGSLQHLGLDSGLTPCGVGNALVCAVRLGMKDKIHLEGSDVYGFA